MFHNAEILQQEIADGLWAMSRAAIELNKVKGFNVLTNRNQLPYSEQKKFLEASRRASRPQAYKVHSADEMQAGYKRPKAEVMEAEGFRSIEEMDFEGVVVICLSGVLMKNGGMCSKGTADTLKELIAAGNNGYVKGVVLKIYSPGGSVYGTEQLAKEVAGFEAKYNKPIAAFIDDQACSGAYWIASQCSKVFLAGQTTSVGSIGVMITLIDASKAMEELGVQEIVIRATKSFNKNEEDEQAMKGNITPMQVNMLDKINEVFISAVKKGRPGLDLTLENGVPAPLTGRVYFGKDAINIGLADDFNTLEGTIKYVDNQSRKMKNAQMPAPSAKASSFIIGSTLSSSLKTDRYNGSRD